jgi:16S rRNA (cytosine967-C5)-methyltransferase
VEQLAAPDGGRVLDACAAPGGKTGQILEAFPGARVTALDLSARRLDRVRDALRRIGAEAELVQGDAAEPAAWWDGEPFDAILLDAPCSASGILRRQPDVKWHRRRTDLPPLVDLQARMLDALWPLLRPGGRLVYATCSVLRDENDRQIADFLARTDDAEDRTERPSDAAPVAAGWQLLTRDNGPDGFYLACLHKRKAADDNKVTDQRS